MAIGQIGSFGFDAFGSGMNVACGCAACRLSNGEGETRDAAAPGTMRDAMVQAAAIAAHVSTGTNAMLESSTRSYAVLTQTRNADGSWSFSGDRNTDAVLIGSKITVTDLTFSFPSSGDVYGAVYDMGQQRGFLALNDFQQAAARDAFGMVASYTNLTFRELSTDEGAAERPTFRLAQTTSDQVRSAMGNFPHSAQPTDGQNPSGDIWFGRTGQPYYTEQAKGNWGYVTMLHEIGHTLGLKHGGDDYTRYDLGPMFGLSTALFGTRALEYAKDGQAWSLMTYNVAPGTRNGFNGDGVNSAQSYMQYDIAALQYLYGANFGTQAGDTVYRWNERTGEKSINGVGQGAPTGNKVLETIWDGGGIDTYDLSNYDGGVTVDLRPGGFLTLSTQQLANAEGFYDGDAPMIGNVASALLYKGDTRSLIENAIGGDGDDTMIGNQAANVLIGGTGDDRFDGMAGSDLMDGGAGSDTAAFSSATTGIVVVLNDGRADVRVANGADVDTLRSIENVAGTRFSDVLVGDAGDNVLSGGAGGYDVLLGGGGNDRLIAGGYELGEVDRPDIVKDASVANGTRDTAVSLDGTFELAARAGVADAATIPHSTVVATASKAGIEYYRFTATAGSNVTFDVDGIDAYMVLQLLDASGALLAQNFEALSTDEGTRISADPRLKATVPADGIYYVAVSGRAGNPGSYSVIDLPVGLPYTLHVSLENVPVAGTTLLSTASAVMDGGAGDDMLMTSMGDDVMLGGAGKDTASYEQSYLGVVVDLGTSGPQATGAGRDTITDVENLIGSRQADMLRGDARANVIDGGGGADVLHGGAGADTISFASQTKAATFDLSRQGQRQGVRLGETVLATGFENVIGTASDDTLSGDRGANTLNGGAGNDILIGNAAGQRGTGVDTLVGGAGEDTASFAPYGARIVAALARDGSGTATADGTKIALLREIENLRGGTGDDRLTGNDLANLLWGGAGNDVIDGGRGDDTVEGGEGDDMLTGGAGRDTLVYAGKAALRLDLRHSDAQDTGYGADRVTGFENVRLNVASSIVTGDAADNIFHDGGGDDTVDGGAGVDTMDYSAARKRVVASLALAGAQDTGGGGTDVLAGIERLVGGDFGNRLTGNAGANRMTGGAAADTIIGGAGADVILGGAGEDVLIGDLATTTDFSGTGMNDLIEGGQGVDFIVGGQGDDTLRGGGGNDRIIGGSADFTVHDDDQLRSSTSTRDGGNDVIDGGDGYDNVTLQFGGRKEGVAIDLSESVALNLLYSDGIAVGSVTNVESATLFGGDRDDRFVGTTGNDDLRGDVGDDVLIGGLGNDFLSGGVGNDFIDGGEGHDIADFGLAATRGLTLDLRNTEAQDTGAWGIDTVRNVEEIYTTIYSDTVIGGDENAVFRDDRGGSDRFWGNGGDDVIEVVRYHTDEGAWSIMLDGGTGNDRLRYGGGPRPEAIWPESFYTLRDDVVLNGGAGNDFIESINARTSTINAGEGDDIVVISVAGTETRTAYDITLGAGIDELAIQYASPAAADRAHDDIVVHDFKGGVGGDVLGLTGFITSVVPKGLGTFNPFIAGVAALVKDGADTLLQIDRDGRFGDAPLVTVMRLKGTNAFSLGAANVYAYIFDEVALTNTPIAYVPIITQFLRAGQSTLVGHDGRDDLRGGRGDDSLFGMAGDDIINGEGGNDTLIGGLGADYILGDAGNDRLDGGGGADTLLGGSGDDTYVVDDTADIVAELAGSGVDTVYASVSHTLGDEVENLYLAGKIGLEGKGNALDNGLFGTGGNDTLRGADGDDLLRGWAGDDRLFGDAGRDALYGAEGADWLDGGAGADLLDGGIGNDNYAVDDEGDRLHEAFQQGRGGIDTVRAAVDWTLGANFELLYLTGAAAVDGTGNALDNVLHGNDAANVLRGGAGRDTLVGMAGDDTLYGGAGADTFVFGNGAGRDVVADFGVGDVIDLASYRLQGAPTVTGKGTDVLIDLGGGDTITLLNVQPDQLTFTGGAFGFAA